MRKVVAHLIMTLDGVVKFDVVADTIVNFAILKKCWRSSSQEWQGRMPCF